MNLLFRQGTLRGKRKKSTIYEKETGEKESEEEKTGDYTIKGSRVRIWKNREGSTTYI